MMAITLQPVYTAATERAKTLTDKQASIFYVPPL